MTSPATLDNPERTDKPPTARIVEIFSSIQGEAELIGARQVFLRFFGCNIRCTWCDSPETLTAPKGKPQPGRVEQTPGRADFRPIENMASVESVLDAVLHLAGQAPHHSVSLTGGEPLGHARFLQSFLPELRAAGQRAYLESNGLLPNQLGRILPWLDWIGMDLKPPSCTGDPSPEWLERHRAFLRTAQPQLPSRPRIFFKLIVGADADEAEMLSCFRLAAEEAPTASLTLQPVTPFGPVTKTPSMDAMLRWHAMASDHISDVRVIPQVHKLMQIL